MAYTLNFLGAMFQATSLVLMTFIVSCIYAQPRIRRIPELLIGIIWITSQAFLSCVVSFNLYFRDFPIWTGVCRVGAGLISLATVFLIGSFVWDYVRAARRSYEEGLRQQDEHNERMMAAQFLATASEASVKSSEKHIHLLQKQGARVA